MIIFGLKTETINFNKELYGSKQWVVIGNHVSFLDPIILFVVFPGILRFMYKSGLDKLPIISSGLKTIGFISVDRKNPRKGQNAIKKAIELIKKDKDSIAIFPGGGRSISGKIRNFKRGAFILAKENKIPILPVYLKGFYNAMPKGRNIIYPTKLIFEFLPPIEVSQIERLSSEELRDYAHNLFLKKEKENERDN
jgi:1-acyl-sn-glycerol-3-phosphate acyltransferase